MKKKIFFKAFRFSFGDYYCIIRHLSSKRSSWVPWRIWEEYQREGPVWVSDLRPRIFSSVFSGCIISPFSAPKKTPQNSPGPYQHDTRKLNPTLKPDHLQMYFSPRFNSRRFLGEASFRKSACQFLEARRLVSSPFSRFLSTHKVNVHREWAWI